MKKWLCLALLAVLTVSGCTGGSGELPTAPPVTGTPAGGAPTEPASKATKRQAAGAIDQRGLVE